MAETKVGAKGSRTGAEGSVASDALGGGISWSALIAVLIWSGMSPLAKFALETFPPFAYMSFRPVIVTVIIFGFLLATRKPLGIDRADRRLMFLAGAFGLGFSQLGYILGLARTSVSHAVILLSVSPLLMAIWRWIRGSTPERRTMLGVLLGFGGVVTLVAGSGGSSGASVLGDLLTLFGAVAWMFATIMPAPLLPKYGSIKVSGWLFLCSLAVTLPLGLISIPAVIRANPPRLAWASLLYSAILGNLIGNTLWNRAVQTVGPSRTMIYLYLEPVGALLLAAIFLDERLTFLQGAGAVMAMAGVVMVRK